MAETNKTLRLTQVKSAIGRMHCTSELIPIYEY